MASNPIVTIGGTARSLSAISITAAQDNTDRFQGDIESSNGSYSPAIDDIISVVDEDGNTIFGGTIKAPTLKGKGDSKVAWLTSASASDFNELGTRFPLTMSIAAGTLKAAITAVVAQVNANLPAALAITVSGSQVNGPSLPALNYIDTLPENIFADLATRSGYVRNIDYSRVILFWSPGSIAAPWNVSDATSFAFGDMTVATTRIQNFANRIIVRYWWPGIAAYAFFSISGSVSDGETVSVGGRTYTFKNTLTPTAGEVLNDSNRIGNLCNAINAGPGSGTAYAAGTTVNGVVGALQLSTSGFKAQSVSVGLSGNSVAVATTLANGHWFWEGNTATSTLLGGLDAGVGNSINVDDATSQASVGVYATIVDAPNVFTSSDAIALGNAILATTLVVQKTVTYTTLKSGLACGQTQTIQRSNRGMNDSCLITQIVTRWWEGKTLVRTVTAVTGNVFKGNPWLDQYKKWSGGGGSVNAQTVSFGGGGTPAASGATIYFLGGSPSVYVRSATPTWVPADGSPAANVGTEAIIDTAARGSLVATVQCRLRALSGSVTARLVDELGNVVGTSGSYTGTAYASRPFAVTLTPGTHRYHLELLPGTSNADVNGVGYLV